MRLSRKLMLLATMAIAATALAAPSAFAQTEPLPHHAVPDLGVSAEPGGTPCPAVVRSGHIVTGGCAVHMGGSATLIGHIFGIEAVQSTCNVEFDLRTDADGEGYLVHQELTQGGSGTCNRIPCGADTGVSPEGRPWEVSAREAPSVVPREFLTVLLCIENLDHTTQRHCEFDIPMSEPTNHRYSVVALGPTPSDGLPGHGEEPFCEISATLSTESTQLGNAEGQPRTQVEINHL